VEEQRSRCGDKAPGAGLEEDEQEGNPKSRLRATKKLEGVRVRHCRPCLKRTKKGKGARGKEGMHKEKKTPPS